MTSHLILDQYQVRRQHHCGRATHGSRCISKESLLQQHSCESSTQAPKAQQPAMHETLLCVVPHVACGVCPTNLTQGACSVLVLELGVALIGGPVDFEQQLEVQVGEELGGGGPGADVAAVWVWEKCGRQAGYSSGKSRSAGRHTVTWWCKVGDTGAQANKSVILWYLLLLLV